ncbi:hypothetical protein Pmi06nite_31960 [Planotetraspora mira]|uniref:Uncharacterized protein n=1 Tax=Planotetraspora mira TaxID=58121 RepID=A0A8J3TPC2_9ACTN|nr:hypothetical protein Pmi06nite_31960 [Planotetraspora mira]
MDLGEERRGAFDYLGILRVTFRPLFGHKSLVLLRVGHPDMQHARLPALVPNPSNEPDDGLDHIRPIR